MSEKTEAQIDREKQAVAAMTNAKANMATVIERVQTLERHLRNARGVISILKRHVGSESMIDIRDRKQFVASYIDDQISEITKIVD